MKKGRVQIHKNHFSFEIFYILHLASLMLCHVKTIVENIPLIKLCLLKGQTKISNIVGLVSKSSKLLATVSL